MLMMINERSSAAVRVSLKDKAGVAAPPSTVKYRIDCLTTGTVLLATAESVNPGASFTVPLTPAINGIVNAANRSEYKRLSLEAHYANGDELTAEYDWIVSNLKFIPLP